MFFDLLLGIRDGELRLLALDPLVVLHEALGDAGLRHADGNDLDAGGPLVRARGQGCDQILVETVEFIDEHLLQRVTRAELVDLVTAR